MRWSRYDAGRSAPLIVQEAVRGLPPGWYLDPAAGSCEFADVSSTAAGSSSVTRRICPRPARRSASIVAARSSLRHAGHRWCVARFPQRLPAPRCAARRWRSRTRASRSASSRACAALITAGPTTRPAHWLRCPDRSVSHDFDPALTALRPVHVEQWRGLVFVAVEPPAVAISRRARAVRAAHDVARGGLAPAPAGRAAHLCAPGGLETRQRTCCSTCSHRRDRAPDGKAAAVRAQRVRSVPGRWPCMPSVLSPSGAPRRPGPSARMRDGSRGRTAPTAESLFVWPNLLLQFAPDQLAVIQVLPRPNRQLPAARGGLRHARREP